MELVDMKLPKKSEKEMKAECAPVYGSDKQDRWPYGLRLRFETEQVKKLPELKNYKVGDKVEINAIASVIEVRMSETQSTDSEKEARYAVELQIEQIACKPKFDKPLEKMSPKEYRRARESK